MDSQKLFLQVVATKQTRFSQEEKKKFKSMKAPQIIAMISDTPLLQSSPAFYENVPIAEIESIISTVFSPTNCKEKNLYTIVTALKEQTTTLLKVCFRNPVFNHMCIFSFLLCKIIDEKLLILLEDCILPFARAHPEKLILLLHKDLELKKRLIDLCYHRPIYKLIYTIVFCLSEKQLTCSLPEADELMTALIREPFAFQPKLNKIIECWYDTGDLFQNLRELITDICFNFSSISNGSIVKLLTFINAQYLQECWSLLEKYQRKEDESYVEGCMLFLLSLFHLRKELIPNEKEMDLNLDPKVTQLRNEISRITKSITDAVPNLYFFLLKEYQQPKAPESKMLKYSSGQNLRRFGIINYRILCIICKVLAVKDQPSLEKVLEEVDLIWLVQKLLSEHKWNNIVHLLLVEIAKFCIVEDYDNFHDRHLHNQDYNQGFLANLVENFRNRKYVFLSTAHLSNNGDRHAIYEISKAITNQLQKDNILNEIIAKFPVWETFISKDLQQYEMQLKISKYFTGTNMSILFDPNIPLKSSLEIGLEKPLETIQELVELMEERKRWSPSPQVPKRPRRRKESMANFDVMSQIDRIKEDSLGGWS